MRQQRGIKWNMNSSKEHNKVREGASDRVLSLNSLGPVPTLIPDPL